MAGFLSVGNFLVSLIFSSLIFILWLRIILRYFRVSRLHALGSNIYNFTDPILLPIEQLIYGKSARIPRYDWVCLGAIFVLEMLKFTLLSLIIYQGILSFGYLILFSLADFIINPCNLLFYALILRVVLSWVNTSWQQHPAADILIMITNPLLNLGRQIIPDISGFDFSPFVIMIILKIITLFISASMPGTLL